MFVASATSRVHPHVLGVFNARCCCSVRFGPDAICESRSRRGSRRLEQRGLEESNLDSRESPLRRLQCIALKMHLCPYWATLVVFVGVTSIPLEPLDVSYLVDPASSHMLVSKIKPCMSKYKRFYTVKLRMAH